MGKKVRPEPKGFFRLIAEVVKSAARLGGTTIRATKRMAFAAYSFAKLIKVVFSIGMAVATSDPAMVIDALKSLSDILIVRGMFSAFEFAYSGGHYSHDWQNARHEWENVRKEWRKLKLHSIRLWRFVNRFFGE